MGATSLQVCMESPDDYWLQGTVSEEGADQTLDSSSDDILAACSGTLIERRLRPQHEQSLKCPRCESTRTKFCYYNNYSLSQPRYFCKACRRYWTKGGALRNIPVGGGCRKNKKASSYLRKESKDDNNKTDTSNNTSNDVAKPNSNIGFMSSSSGFSCGNPNFTDLHLSFPETPFASLSSDRSRFLTSDITTNPIFVLENNPTTTPINFMMENKSEGLVSRGQNYGCTGCVGNNFDGIDANDGEIMTRNICSPFVMSLDDHHGMKVSTTSVDEVNNVPCSQMLMMQYDQNRYQYYHHMGDQSYQEVDDDKPIISTNKVLSVEETMKDQYSFEFGIGGLGPWAGLMNGYGSSATYPLV